MKNDLNKLYKYIDGRMLIYDDISRRIIKYSNYN